MGNDTVGSTTLRHWYFPLLGRGLDQHLPRHGATLANILLTTADTLATTGRETAPDIIASNILSRGRILGGDPCPVALQFLGHHLCQAGQGALSHFGTSDANNHGIIRFNHDPGIDLWYRC